MEKAKRWPRMGRVDVVLSLAAGDQMVSQVVYPPST